MDKKLLNTYRIFDEYEKRFAAARCSHKLREPWKEHEREEIKNLVKDVLCFNDDMIPQISVIDKNYFISKTNYQDYKTNLDKNFSIIGADSAKEAIGEVNYFITGSLKSADFDYTISSVYSKDNSYYVDVEVNIKKNARTSVNYNNTKINYIPIRFTVSYANTSDCITDTFNNSYKYATYYVIVR